MSKFWFAAGLGLGLWAGWHLRKISREVAREVEEVKEVDRVKEIEAELQRRGFAAGEAHTAAKEVKRRVLVARVGGVDVSN